MVVPGALDSLGSETQLASFASLAAVLVAGLLFLVFHIFALLRTCTWTAVTLTLSY
jgi:hypothetical protein